jgi:hypothetical protein
MRKGYPNPRFTAGGSQGSAPAAGHQRGDPYRDAMKAPGPPPNSQFQKEYDEYKKLDAAADLMSSEFHRYMRDAPKISKRTNNANPGVYKGQPLGTGSWHAEATQIAARAEVAYRKQVKNYIREKPLIPYPELPMRAFIMLGLMWVMMGLPRPEVMQKGNLREEMRKNIQSEGETSEIF